MNGLQKILRQLQTVCKVVRAAGGNVGNGRFAPDGVKAGDDFVERAVAANAENDIELCRTRCCDLGRVAAGCGHVRRDVIAAAVEDVDDLRKHAVGFFLPRTGIHQNQQFFHIVNEP